MRRGACEPMAPSEYATLYARWVKDDYALGEATAHLQALATVIRSVARQNDWAQYPQALMDAEEFLWSQRAS